MRVRRPLEHRLQQLHIKDILRVGQILRDLLFDRAPLLVPQRFTVQQAPHADGFDVQGDPEVLDGHGKKVLRDRLLGVGVGIAAHGGGDPCQLVRRQPWAAAKHHVLQSVGRARKPCGAFIRTDAVIDDRRHHRRQRIADDNDPQPIREGGAQHIRLRWKCRGSGR